MFQRDYSNAEDQSHDDEGNGPSMLFRVYTWRSENIRTINFSHLAALPEKVPKPRTSPPNQGQTEFEKKIKSLKVNLQPTKIEFDEKFIAASDEPPQWKTTKQQKYVDVVTYDLNRTSTVCDKYMRARLTIKYCATADKPWESIEPMAELESYPELQTKKYRFDVTNTTKGATIPPYRSCIHNHTPSQWYSLFCTVWLILERIHPFYASNVCVPFLQATSSRRWVSTSCPRSASIT